MHGETRKVGSIDCPVCGEQMPVRQNGRDTLNLSCPWCGVSSYAKGGSDAHRIVTGWLGKGEAPDREPPAPAAPVPATVPVPAARAPASKQPAAMPWEM